MTVPMRFFVIAIVSLIAVPGRISAEGIERASVEMIAPGTYRIDFAVSADGWPVAIYPSSRPDTIDKDARPVTARSARVTMKAAGPRVYFHLRPAVGPTRVAALRHIPLEGSLNLRDLGGYRTADGRHLKWGLVYRSDNLGGLTAADYRTMNSLGLQLICDLRSPTERAQAPTAWQGGTAPQILATGGADLPAGTPVPRATQTANSARMSDAALRKVFEDLQAGRAVHEFDIRYPDLSLAQTTAYRAIFARLISGDLPALTHCTAGQDRTGVFAAVLLLALGVPQDTVVEDYVLTNRLRRSDEYIDATRIQIQKRLGLRERPSFDAVRWIEDNHPSNLNAALAAIEVKWGSFKGYLEQGLDLSPARLKQLQSRLLED